jgi:hypothetical protein
MTGCAGKIRSSAGESGGKVRRKSAKMLFLNELAWVLASVTRKLSCQMTRSIEMEQAIEVK